MRATCSIGRSVEALADRLARLLAGAVAAPDRAIGSLDILGAEERSRILVGWNATAHALPRASVVELFAAQAARTPMRWRWSSRTSASPMRSSIGPRTSWRITCGRWGSAPRWWWACASSARSRWWSGCSGYSRREGAYLPLDPSYPRERLAFMLADAGAPVLVTQSGLIDRLPAHDAQVVCLDADWAAIAAQPATAPALALDPHHPAYVIYTSGSTGTPKGVAVTHGGLQQLPAGDAGAGRPLDRHDRLMAVTTIGFDIAALELFLPLISGARCCPQRPAATAGIRRRWRARLRERQHDHAGDADAVAGDCRRRAAKACRI